MRAIAGAAIATFVSACSFVGVKVPETKPAPPDLECSYKLPIIDTVFVAGSVVGAIALRHSGSFVFVVPVGQVASTALAAIAFFDALSATYGFIEERRCHRVFDDD